MRRPSLGSLVPVAPVLLAAAIAFASLGCSKTALPGNSLGKFEVSGTPTSNSCGKGIEAPNPWVFDVEISRDEDTVYWSFLDASPALRATLDATGESATGTNGTSTDLSQGDAGVVSCIVERTDAFTFALGPDPMPAVVTSKFAYTFSAEPGSSCATQLAAVGGPFDALPCSVAYDLTATKKR